MFVAIPGLVGAMMHLRLQAKHDWSLLQAQHHWSLLQMQPARYAGLNHGQQQTATYDHNAAASRGIESQLTGQVILDV